MATSILTEAEKKVVAVVQAVPGGVTPMSLAHALWPDRRGQGLVIASGSMLARLAGKGVVERIGDNGDGPKTYAFVRAGAGDDGAAPGVRAPSRARSPRRALRPRRSKTAGTTQPASRAVEAAPGWRPLGQVIRTARESRGISQVELAQAAGVAPAYLGAVETGVRVPSEQVLRAIAKRLEVGVERLLFLAGRLGEAADKLLREDGVAATIVRRLTALTPKQRRAVLVMIEAFAGADPVEGERPAAERAPEQAKPATRRRSGSVLENETRQAVVKLLAKGLRSAGDIASQIGCTPSTLTGHLAVLREQGLIDFEQRGRQRIYFVVRPWNPVGPAPSKLQLREGARSTRSHLLP